MATEKKKTYGGFFALDSKLEKEFNRASGKTDKQEVVIVKAYTSLDDYSDGIEDEFEYADATDVAMDKWYGRLDEYGIKRGIPVGGDKEEFYKPTDL